MEEANIGKFDPPEVGAKCIDPKMRKSTEFPIWLDKPETKEMLKNKQVLMYCTGGIRCERASALLKNKMETEEDTKKLGIKGVYQLQGGIDKYFKKFPEGGFWRGKNFVFDKRVVQSPPIIEAAGINSVGDRIINHKKDDGVQESKVKEAITTINDDSLVSPVLGSCEACLKPWDVYKGKRRCPTCGVPSLICKDCQLADEKGMRKIDQSVRCKLCIEENITSKKQLKDRLKKDSEKYHQTLKAKYQHIKQHCTDPNIEKHNEKNHVEASTSMFSQAQTQDNTNKVASNPQNIKRIIIKNMSVTHINESNLRKIVKGILHIHWIKDKQSNIWYGAAFVEMVSPMAASIAVGTLNGKRYFGRDMNVTFADPRPHETSS